jgi:hypothetical protein
MQQTQPERATSKKSIEQKNGVIPTKVGLSTAELVIHFCSA